jgi:Uma2 family endonuclease
MPVLPDVAAFTLAPDWVGEVLSPSTEAFDRSEKMPRYARQGVGHLWLLDPVLRTLEVFRLAGAFWQLVATHAGNASVQAEPFEAILLDLSALWAP